MTIHPAAARPRVGGPAILAAICLAPLVGLLLATALSPFFPLIAADLHTSVPLLGQIPAASMLVAAVLSLVVGPLTDHSGHRRLLLAGCAGRLLYPSWTSGNLGAGVPGSGYG